MTRTWKLSAPLLFVLAAALTFTGGTTAAVVAHRSAAISSVTLTGDAPNLSLVRDLGALPASRQVAVGVLVTDPNQAAEQALYHQLYTPGSPLYHQFLTPAQYSRRFSAPDSTKSAIRDWLTSGGLNVTFAMDTGYYWVARGPAGDVNRLFDVQLRSYSYAGETFYANNRAPKVPGSLGIRMVFLTDMMQARIASTFAQGAPETAFTATPKSLWQLYGAPSSDTGQGEQLGILGFLYKPDDPSLGQALRDFESDNHLPKVPLRIIPTDTTGIDSTNIGAEGEWELDTQASSGMAPGALDIDFYDGASGSLTDGGAEIAYWAEDPNGPRQASASWGQCEDNPVFQAVGLGYAQTMIDGETQAVMEGRTLFSSTGDTGSGCVFPFNAVPVNLNGIVISPEPFQSMPADLPYTVAVGGTVIYPQDNGDGTVSRSLEYSWTHGGGGPSRFIAAPDYQQGVSNIVFPCISDYTGGTTTTGDLCRGVPDLAAMSGDITGLVPDGVVRDDYQIRDATGGGCTPTPPQQTCQTTTGGTSLSSPLTLGMWTRVAAAASKPLGFANELIYAVGKDPARYANDFFDVVVGANGLYHAAPGWDYTSGWGVMNVGAFAADVTGNASLNPTHSTNKLPPLPKAPGPAKTAAPKTPVSDIACTNLWSQAPGSDTFVGREGLPSVDQGQNPQLDLITSRYLLTADRKTLRMQLVIDNLSKTVPPYSMGDVYWGIFTYAGTEYYGAAEVDPVTGSVTYYWGTDSSSGYAVNGFVSGTFGSGPSGIVEIDVPLSTFGAFVASDFTNTGAETWVLTGVNSDIASTAGQPSLTGEGALQPVDLSPTDASGNFTGRTYQVGEECTPPLLKLASISSTAGEDFSGTVATFTDKRASDQASEFAATIAWGDGSSSAGAVSGANGHFTVSGSHMWSDSGPRHVSVSLRQLDDPGRPASSAAGTATVEVAALSTSGASGGSSTAAVPVAAAPAESSSVPAAAAPAPEQAPVKKAPATETAPHKATAKPAAAATRTVASRSLIGLGSFLIALAVILGLFLYRRRVSAG